VLRSSVPLGLATLFTALINRADFIMLERMTTLDQVGLYAAAYKVSNLLETFPIMVMATVYPLMCRYAREDMGRLRELYRKSVVSLGVVAVPLAVGVTLLAPTVVRILFGSEFAGAAPGLMVLIWSTVCVYVALGGGNLLISMRYERVNLALNVLGAAVNIALNLLLIPRMGITGAALATTVTYLVIAVGTLVGSYLALHPASAGPAMSAVLLRLRA
jgi:O-antigen/teichoic acid export membrane protein